MLQVRLQEREAKCKKNRSLGEDSSNDCDGDGVILVLLQARRFAIGGRNEKD
jgi:hypothetical protein